LVYEKETGVRREALREALIGAAERAIGERGYQALRARDLAREVGCALGAIYSVFPDLDALVLAVKARTLDDLDAEIGRRAGAAEGAPSGGPVEAAIQRLLALAQTYLAFASERPRQWRALFEHRSADAHVPENYLAKLTQILGHVERPLEVLMPHASADERRLFGQGLFAAVHGIVALGLDEKLGALPADVLSQQMRAIVEAAANGVAGRDFKWIGRHREQQPDERSAFALRTDPDEGLQGPV
jgi:AcrR family transcriptional regulator